MINYYFRFKMLNYKRLTYPEIQMTCNIPFNLHNADSKWKSNYLHIEQQLINWLREFDGIYYTGEQKDGGYRDTDGFHKIEYHFRVVGDTVLAEELVKHFKQLKINHTERLEATMAKSDAPYKLWSIQTLKDECKRRKFKKADYAELDDKKLLIALLEAHDKKVKKSPPADDKKKIAINKKTKPASDDEDEDDEAEDDETPDEELEDEDGGDETGEVDDDETDEVDDDETDDETPDDEEDDDEEDAAEPTLSEKLDDMDRSELKAYIRENEKELGFGKVKKSWTEDDIREKIVEASGDEDEEDEVDEPAEPTLAEILADMDRSGLKTYIRENAKALGFEKVKKSWSDDDIRANIIEASDEPASEPEKPKKVLPPSEPVILNGKLREMKLWQKGMQFLSTADKNILIKTKGKGKDAEKVMKALKIKLKAVEKKTSAALKVIHDKKK